MMIYKVNMGARYANMCFKFASPQKATDFMREAVEHFRPEDDDCNLVISMELEEVAEKDF